MGRLSIDEIAKLAGVSIATVSRVLNNPEKVREETRSKVNAVIKAHRYYPMSSARQLSTRISLTLALIVPGIENPFYGGLTQGISEIAEGANLTLMCFNTGESFANELRILEKLNELRVAGLFYTPCCDYVADKKGQKIKQMIQTLDAPAMLLDRRADFLGLPGAYYNDARAICRTTCEAIAEGHRDIVLISGARHLRITRDREEAFCRALEEQGIAEPRKRMLRSDYSLETSYEVAKELLGRPKRPSAVFCINNNTTLGLLKASLEKGLVMGDDIRVISLDNIEALRFTNTRITFIDRNPVRLGRAAAHNLIARIGARSRPEGGPEPPDAVRPVEREKLAGAEGVYRDLAEGSLLLDPEVFPA